MNREKALEKMLPTWTKVNQIKDFVIVDWSSDKPIINNRIVQEQISKYKNIKIIRVESQKYFYRCFAWNLAFKNTNNENNILLKLDVDYMNINEEWLDCLSITNDGRKSLHQYFITGSSQFYPYSLGFLLVNKKDFGKGYNENLEAVWGFEDLDLIQRIKKNNSLYDDRDYADNGKGYLDWIGIERIIFFNINKYIYHIPHTNEDRIKNLKYSNLVLDNGFSEGQKWILAKKNKLVSEYFPDWISAEYKTLEESENYKRVELINSLPKTER